MTRRSWSVSSCATAFRRRAQAGAGLLLRQALQEVIVVTDHVHQRKRRAVVSGFDVVGKGHILRRLFLGTEMHEDLIFHAPCRIGGKAGAFGAVEGGDAFDKPNGADGDQVLLI